MSTEKRFPASDLKRDKLRRAGLVPTSSEVLTLGVVVSLGLVFFVVSSNFSGEDYLVKFVNTSSSQGSFSEGGFLNVLSSNFVRELFFYVGVSISIILLLSFFLHLLQTKFLISFSALFRSPSTRMGFGRLVSPDFSEGVFRLVLLAIWLGAAFITANMLFSKIGEASFQAYLPELGNEGADSASLKPLNEVLLLEISESLSLVWQILLGLSFFNALLFYILRTLKFEKEQMMTREEVEREAKDYEVSEEMRREQWERSR